MTYSYEYSATDIIGDKIHVGINMSKRHCIFVAILFVSMFSSKSWALDKLSFWQSTPRGANMSTLNPASDFYAASQYGIHLLRFGATGSPSDLTYFVKGMPPNDSWDLSRKNIDKLKNAIATAAQNNLNVVISLAHIPGRSWAYRQRDNRIWDDERYQESFVDAWKTLALELKDQPNVVGYDLLNEPYFPSGNAYKLWNLYRNCIAAIRQVDSNIL
jgi:hypothetical protein